MLTPVRWAAALLLFILLFAAFRLFLAAAFGRPGMRRFRRGFRSVSGDGFRSLFRSGTGFRRRTAEPAWRRFAGREWAGRPVRSRARAFGRAGRNALAARLEAADAGLTPAAFAALSVAASAFGLAAGTAAFESLKGMLVPGAVGLALPSLWLRSRLAGRQIRRRKDLLPALESFYQELVLSPGGNIRSAIRRTVESGRLPRHAQAVFERLHAGLTVHRDLEDCLLPFADAFASRWADQFAGLLQIALEDGADISGGLRELISDMRRAQRIDQAERNKLLEIRLVSFSPLLFLAIFLAVNFRLDPEMAHRHYIASDAGREMLLHALAMIVLSFALGVYLSLRKE